MAGKEIRDESLLDVNGGRWTYDTLTPEEQKRFNEVYRGLNDEWNYIDYNEFILEMNNKYGE